MNQYDYEQFNFFCDKIMESIWAVQSFPDVITYNTLATRARALSAQSQRQSTYHRIRTRRDLFYREICLKIISICPGFPTGSEKMLAVCILNIYSVSTIYVLCKYTSTYNTNRLGSKIAVFILLSWIPILYLIFHM